jgi:amino acid permease
VQRIGYKVIRYLMICSIRTLLVLVSWGVAIGIPRFELCLALVGSFATSILAFVLPPLFHLSLFWRDGRLLRRLFHGCLLMAGALVTVLATSINLYMAIEGHSSPVTCKSIKHQCNAHFNTSDAHCFSHET